MALVFECGDGQKTKAVCLDKGLDFDVGDVITADLGPLADNRLFRGGEVREQRRFTGRRTVSRTPPLIPASPGHGALTQRVPEEISSDVLTESVERARAGLRSRSTLVVGGPHQARPRGFELLSWCALPGLSLAVRGVDRSRCGVVGR